MANTDYTFNNIISNQANYFYYETPIVVSESVRRMQHKLNALGYICIADGQFGSGTETAVKNFQTAKGLTSDGKAGYLTLSKLDTLHPDTTTENYGRELTHSQITSGYSNSNISDIEAVARCIFGEDNASSDGEKAVAKEIYNRKHTTGFSTLGNTYRGIVYSPSQYAVMTSSSSSDTTHSRRPNIYSTTWANCVTYATNLVNSDSYFSTTLTTQDWHLSAGSSYPAGSINRLQIPASTGNKFYNKSTDPNL